MYIGNFKCCFSLEVIVCCLHENVFYAYYIISAGLGEDIIERSLWRSEWFCRASGRVRLELDLRYDIKEPEATSASGSFGAKVYVFPLTVTFATPPRQLIFADLLFHGNRHTLEFINHI